MSVWLTPPGATGEGDPGLKPFFAGTYYPPEPKFGRIAFPDLMNNIADIWQRTPEQITDQAENIAQAVREQFELEDQYGPDEMEPRRMLLRIRVCVFMNGHNPL